MSVIVDTSVWSLSLRRGNPVDDTSTRKLSTLIEQGQPIMLLGVILQEVLQGIRDETSFTKVKSYLEAFPILALDRQSYVLAAELRNRCRSKGVQAGTIDIQIVAACIQHDCLLLTADNDFTHIAKHCPLQLL